MTRTRDLDATLRSLDPAEPTAHGIGARGRADLRTILASDPGAASPLASAPSARRGTRAVRRVALAAAAATAVAAGMVVLPTVAGGGDRAFATWTAAPQGLTPSQAAEAAAGCRADLTDGQPADVVDRLAAARPAVAERRGVWTTVVLAGADGFSGLCVTDDSAGLFETGMIGSLGTPAGYVAPAPRELRATDLGTGTMSTGHISLAAGSAGAGVRDVVYRSGTYGDVAATVSEGRFAFWLPGDELDGAERDGVDVEVTYADGTTATQRLTF